MSTDITQFLFQPAGSPVKHKVRTVTRDGEPWFVLADVCSVLEIAKDRDAASRLDADERGSVVVDTPGGPQTVNTINESGLWSLVLNSRKPEAKAFKKWLTSEVIPSLRKHGGYIVGQETKTREQLLADAVLVAQSVVQEQAALIEQQAGQLAEQAPRVATAKALTECEGEVTGISSGREGNVLIT